MLFFWPLRLAFFRLGLLVLVFSNSTGAALAQTDWKKDWERSVQEAKKEGQIVVGIPARPELRKQLAAVFKPKFGNNARERRMKRSYFTVRPRTTTPEGSVHSQGSPAGPSP